METTPTLKGFLKQSNYALLTECVINQIDIDFNELVEYANDYRDASAGVNGFIYYTDTHAFTIANRDLILNRLENDAEDLGEDVVDMVKSFGVFRGNMDRDDKKDLYRFLGGCEVEQGAITNVLAWYALEQTINDLINYINE